MANFSTEEFILWLERYRNTCKYQYMMQMDPAQGTDLELYSCSLAMYL